MTLQAGQWLRVQSGILDNYRGAGFSRWYVERVTEGGEVHLSRKWLNEDYTRTISPASLGIWEKCSPPTAWAP